MDIFFLFHFLRASQERVLLVREKRAKFSSIHTTFSEHQLCTEHYFGCQRYNTEQGGQGPCCQAYVLAGGRQALNNKPTGESNRERMTEGWMTEDLPEEVTHVELGMLESHTA